MEQVLGAAITTPAEQAASRWAASGAMALTGREDGPPLAGPARVALAMDALADSLAASTAQLGKAVEVDGAALLGERAAYGALHRRGDVSCGGGTRLLPAADEWIAVALARGSDRELVPAWLSVTGEPVDAGDWIAEDDDEASEEQWQRVQALVARQRAARLVEQAIVLGMPCARLGELDASQRLVATTDWGESEPARLDDLVVVDLSSLWAGPLCANLLGLGGAQIVKVESTARPDGARHGPGAFYDLLHGGHDAVAIDLGTADGHRQLELLLRRADIVIEASRPRALAAMGIEPDAIASHGKLKVWASITGFGRSGAAAERVAFGDDAAVAGGLVGHDDRGPVFCVDAIADPATGLLAAAAVADLLVRDRRGLVDVALARTAAHLSALTSQHGPVRFPNVTVHPPTAREPTEPAASIGEHNAKWLQPAD